jgi:hypothetical protein
MKWEYEIIQIQDNENLDNLTKLKDELNKYGSDGWEVVEIIRKKPIGTGWLSNSEKNFVVLKKAFN